MVVSKKNWLEAVTMRHLVNLNEALVRELLAGLTWRVYDLGRGANFTW